MALFITFEGIEGCGKTTQIRLLADSLRQSGQEVLVTREPGGCPVADAVRRILLDPEYEGMVPTAELLLYAAARAQHVEEIVRPAMNRGKFVLCDRFMDATIAYQGYGRGLDLSLIEHLNGLASGGLHPHLTFLLDLPLEEGLRRARRRNAGADIQEGRFEEESLEFHGRVREGYLRIACKEKRFRIINARGTEKEVADRIAAELKGFLDLDGP